MEFRYKLNSEGKIETLGYDLNPEYFPDVLDNDSITMDNAFKWQKINGQWQYIGDFYEIPSNPIIVYDMVPPCPVDENVTSRKIYWMGERHEVMDKFKINILVLHFDAQGNRITKWDKLTWTQADTQTVIDNPLNTGEQVNEYDFFMSLVNSGQPLPEVVRFGIERADLDGTINRRIYEGQ